MCQYTWNACPRPNTDQYLDLWVPELSGKFDTPNHPPRCYVQVRVRPSREAQLINEGWNHGGPLRGYVVFGLGRAADMIDSAAPTTNVTMPPDREKPNEQAGSLPCKYWRRPRIR